MREILFRGKTLNNQDWIEGSLFVDYPCFINDVSVENTRFAYIIDGKQKILNRVQVIPETVGQFTGLTDKNGTKIFEGDILKNIKTNDVVSVKWHETMAGYVWSKPLKTTKYLSEFGELFRVFDKYEVIGNIHSNPELLKGVC